MSTNHRSSTASSSKRAWRYACEKSPARVIPLDKVNHVDGDPRMLLSGPEIPDSFYGGGICGYIDTSEYPEIEAHLAEIEREEY
jgi:hypothetical protein